MSVTRLIFWVLTTCAIIISILLAYQQHFSSFHDPNNCRSLTTYGSWSHDLDGPNGLHEAVWLPSSCMLHNYTSDEIRQCVGNDTILFMGDSSVRQIFWATAKKLDPVKASHQMTTAGRHEHVGFHHGHSALTFIWNPFLNDTSAVDNLGNFRGDHSIHNSSEAPDVQVSVILLGAGLWHARHLQSRYLDQFQHDTLKILNVLRARLRIHDSHHALPLASNQTRSLPILFNPLISPELAKVDASRAKSMELQKTDAMNDRLLRLADENELHVMWAFNSMTKGHITAYDKSGIHVVHRVASVQADIILNLLCNGGLSKRYPYDATCCNTPPTINGVQVYILSVSLFLLIKAVLNLASKFIWRRTTSQMPSLDARCAESFLSKTFPVLSATVLYSFAADRTIYFAKLNKVQDQSMFLSMTSITLAMCFFTVKRSWMRVDLSEDGQVSKYTQGFLNRDQSEEWKGWMQIVVLFYHYFGVSKVLWIYQMVRIFVSSYLFMTGYGHTVFFLQTNNFSLRRVASVLVRLNLLSCVLAYAMRTDYDFYYFPALTSFWFLVVFATLRFMPTDALGFRNVCMRALVSCLTIKTLLSQPGILEFVSEGLHDFCRMNINVGEFRFRTLLDIYMVYVGMIVGSIHLGISRRSEDYWADQWPRLSKYSQQMQSICIVLALGILVGYAFFCSKFMNKFQYNTWHPATSVLPVLAFVTLRNSTYKLRHCHVHLYAILGKCSLETFILQYHIWLAADTKGILHLPLFDHDSAFGLQLPSHWSRGFSFVVITVFFLWSSWCVSRASNRLAAHFVGSQSNHKDHVLPDKDYAEKQSQKLNIIQRVTVDIRTRICGLLLLLWILNWTWTD